MQIIPADAWVGATPIVIAVDMDNTALKWTQRFNERAIALFPDYPIVPEDEQEDYNHLIQPGSDWKMVETVMADPELYRDLEFYDGAIEAMLATAEAGYRDVILTTPDVTNPDCAPFKQDQIRKAFGAEWVKRIIMAHDKTLVNAEILVDDKPVISGLHAPAWTRIMPNRPFNRYVQDGEIVMDTWQDWPRVLAQALISRGRELKDPARWAHVLNPELQAVSV
ncbi:hypothetical protein LG293_16695 (plasmid) [Citricoccus nitrophenolicus]